MKKYQLDVAVVAGLFLSALLCLAIGLVTSCEGVAEGAEETELSTAEAILTLQPAVEAARAAELARVIDEAAAETDLDPLLLVALVMRESSFLATVEQLERLGAAGELGLMQVHPRGPAVSLRPEGCEAGLEGARCQVLTGARFLAHVREQCPGSTWRWVAAYGRSSCPDEQTAREDQSTRTARRYYAAIGGSAWD